MPGQDSASPGTVNDLDTTATAKPRRPKLPQGIRRLPSRRYQVRGADHQSKTVTVGTFPTLAEALTAQAVHRAAVGTGTYIPPEVGAQTLADYMASWLVRKENQQHPKPIKPKTLNSYRTLSRLYICADIAGLNLGYVPLKHLSPTLIADWFNRVRQVAGTLPAPAAFTPEQAARRWLTSQGYEVDPRGGRLNREQMSIWQAAGAPMPKPRSAGDDPKRGAAQAAGAYRVLRNALRDAHRDGLLPQGQPCVLVGAGQSHHEERPLLRDWEVAALAQAMPPRLRQFVLLAAVSGLRTGELLALRRDAVTFTRAGGKVVAAMISVRENAVELNGKYIFGSPKSAAGNRVVPVVGAAAQSLHDHMEQYVGPSGDALVFTTESGAVAGHMASYAWEKARKIAGLEHVHKHDLRHYAATEFRRAGADLEELRRLLGHSSLDMVMRYQHVDNDDLLDVARRMAARAEASALAMAY